MKMKVTLVEQNIRNGAIRWQISKSIKDIAHYGANSQDYRHTSVSNFASRKLRSKSRNTTFAMMLFDCEY